MIKLCLAKCRIEKTKLLTSWKLSPAGIFILHAVAFNIEVNWFIKNIILLNLKNLFFIISMIQ
ncbi:hypothetical protein D1151_09680 [Emergencia sp. 1XD21-10]|nr:hypothetical protein [Emergencia sp. 1XD21-10]